jgi:hypothetical protein
VESIHKIFRVYLYDSPKPFKNTNTKMKMKNSMTAIWDFSSTNIRLTATFNIGEVRDSPVSLHATPSLLFFAKGMVDFRRSVVTKFKHCRRFRCSGKKNAFRSGHNTFCSFMSAFMGTRIPRRYIAERNCRPRESHIQTVPNRAGPRK